MTRPPVSSPRRRPRWVLAGLLLLAATAAVWQGVQFQQRAWSRRLPSLPDVSGQPPELAAALADALRQAAQGSRAGIGGVESLGRILHANGFDREARVCWSLLREIRPAEGRWCYYLADLSRSALRDEEQRNFLEETVRLSPAYSPAWLNLGEFEFKAGRIEAAFAAYTRRLTLLPGDPHARLGMARIALQRGDQADARRQLEQLLREQPGFSSAHNLYSGLLADAGDERAALRERWLGTVAERFRPAADPWLEDLRQWCYDINRLTLWGDIDAQTKHGDRGRAFFERAYRIAPGDSRVCAMLGRFYLDLGETARALTVLENGSKLPHASDRIWATLSEAYVAAGRADEAVNAAERAGALAPESSANTLNLATALESAGRHDQAADAYRAAMAQSPNLAEPAARLGILLARRGRFAEGRALLEQAVAVQPGYPVAAALLGAMELDAGRMDSAARYILPYFRQYPGETQARELVIKLYLARGIAAANAGDASAVRQICDEGLAAVPDSAELHGFLGTFHLHQGRLDPARQHLEISRRIQPGDGRVSYSLAEAYAQLGQKSDARQLWQATEKLAQQTGNSALALRCRDRLEELSP